MTRIFSSLAALLIVSSCGISEFFENRDYGYVNWVNSGGLARNELVKVTIIRDRDESPVRFEGVFETILSNDLAFGEYLVGDIQVRDDGVQVYTEFEKSGGGIVRLYNVRSDRELMDLNAGNFGRDVALSCDLETILAESITTGLQARGIDPSVPYTITFLPVADDSRAVGGFEPLGWTPTNQFAVQGNPLVIGQVSRGGTTLVDLPLQAGLLYISYDVGTTFSTCLIAEPEIKPNRAPYADSTILREPGRSELIVLGGEFLYAFPADAPSRPRPLPMRHPSSTFVGPYR